MQNALSEAAKACFDWVLAEETYLKRIRAPSVVVSEVAALNPKVVYF